MSWPKEQECQNCVYSDDGDSPSDHSIGIWLLCRRHPPRVLHAADDGFPGAVAEFPRVDPEDWCGEWKEARNFMRFLEREAEMREALDADGADERFYPRRFPLD